MPGKTGQQRGNKIPLPVEHWWWAAADEALKRRGDARKGYRSLTEDLRAIGVRVSEDAVRRVFEDRVLTWELAEPISSVLGIPLPAVILGAPPSPVGITAAFESLRTLRESVTPDDQGGPVGSGDEPKGRGPGRGGSGPGRK